MKIEITLKLGKETKGTYRYETDEAEAAVSSLYVRKSSIEGKPPSVIRLVVETVEK
jgi:hypothetical protein